MANPAPSFPTAVHTPTDISAYSAQALGASARPHTQVEGQQEEEISAAQTKMGTGASTPAARKLFYGTAAGVSEWRDEAEILVPYAVALGGAF